MSQSTRKNAYNYEKITEVLLIKFLNVPITCVLLANDTTKKYYLSLYYSDTKTLCFVLSCFVLFCLNN